MSESRIELQVYDKTFTFYKEYGEWESEQTIIGPTMTPIFAAALDQLATLQSDNHTPTHIYCEACGKIQPVLIEVMRARDETNFYVGGDLICKFCKTAVATIYKENR